MLNYKHYNTLESIVSIVKNTIDPPDTLFLALKMILILIMMLL